jgi:hypothetical protein
LPSTALPHVSLKFNLALRYSTFSDVVISMGLQWTCCSVRKFIEQA